MAFFYIWPPLDKRRLLFGNEDGAKAKAAAAEVKAEVDTEKEETVPKKKVKGAAVAAPKAKEAVPAKETGGAEEKAEGKKYVEAWWRLDVNRKPSLCDTPSRL